MKIFNNVILVSGNARNIGKTTLICKIIQHLSKSNSVTAIKVSPHFHKTEQLTNIVINDSKLIIISETAITNKDSSRMMQAGAQQAYFIQIKGSNEKLVLQFIEKIKNNNIIIVEFGGLDKLIRPGLSFFLNGIGTIKKEEYVLSDKTIVLNQDQIELFNPQMIEFENGVLTYNG